MNAMNSKNVEYLLLVEDDPMTQAQNRASLEKKYQLRQVSTIAAARSIIATYGMPRAIVLDIVLPDGNGLNFLRELRKTSNVPVLMLTSQSTKDDIHDGLTAGGDQYLVKPCNPELFVTYVETLLRRSSLLPDALVMGPIRVEPASGRAFVNGVDMLLSHKEFALLQQFVQHVGKILLASDLYERVWGTKMLPDDTSLRSAIYRLRKKLSGSGYTVTVEYKEGYMLEPE